MKHVKLFNESIENQNKQQNEYDPSHGRGSSYKENLGRADNKEVYKILPEIEKLVGNDIKLMTNKIVSHIKSGKMEDTDTRNIAVAIGSLIYDALE